MFPLQTLKDSHSATSLQGSADGVLPCASQECQTLSDAGPEARPASRLAQLESNSANLISATLPQHLLVSSLSAALQCSLENRLRQRLQSTGSMIYLLSWKLKHTPAGRQYCQRVASVRRTNGIDFSLVLFYWNTPAASDGNRGGTGITAGMTGSSLSQLAKTAAWPTTIANAWKHPGNQGRQGGDNIQTAVQKAAWPTSTANDHKGSGPTVIRKDGKDRTFSRLDYATEQGIKKPIRITDSGQLLIGSSARMESSGQLNPEHSRWLMGFPPEWDACAVMAMP